MKPVDYVQNITPAQYKNHLAFARKYGRNTNDAEDFVQESFVRLLKNKTSVRSMKSYVGFTIMNVVRYEHRHTKNLVPYSEEDHDKTGVYQPVEDPMYLIKEAVQYAIARPSKQADIMDAYMKDMTATEIANDTGINYDTVKATFRHGMLRVREYLIAEGYPNE